MRFLAISRPTGKASDGTDDMDAEIANGRRLYEAGVIVEGYMDPSYSTAYFLLEATDEDAARVHLGTYPEVKSGATVYDLLPLVGLPAIQQSAAAHRAPLPSWWPGS